MANIGEGFDSAAIEQDPSIAQIQAAQYGAQLQQTQVSLPATGFVSTINGEDGPITIQPGTSTITAGAPDVDVTVTNGLGTVSVGVDVKLYAAALAKSNVAAIAPTVADDSSLGYAQFSQWIDSVLEDAYICISPALGAAVWKKTTP